MQSLQGVAIIFQNSIANPFFLKIPLYSGALSLKLCPRGGLWRHPILVVLHQASVQSLQLLLRPQLELHPHPSSGAPRPPVH